MTHKANAAPGISCEGLRILFHGSYPPPYGGISGHLKILIPMLQKGGAADIAVMANDKENRTDKVDGITVYRYNLKASARRLLNPANWPLVWTVWRVLRPYGLPAKALLQEMIKAVVTNATARAHHSTVVSSYMAHASVHLLPLDHYWQKQRQFVLTVFGEIYEVPEFMFKHQELVRRLLDLPYVVLASSRHCASSFSQIGVTRCIEPVFYGVELDNVTSQDHRAKFRADHGFADDDIVVFFMGRLVKQMGVDVVTDAAPSMLAGHQAIRLVIAGARGDLSRQVEDLAARYPRQVVALENVSFDMQRVLYSAADILVAPSYNQRACMGVSIKEAMAANLPVVAGAGGGIPEAVVEGETGFLIPVASDGRVDVSRFTSAVLQLAGDSAMRTRMGANGRRRAEELFSVTTTNHRMTEFFVAASQQASRKGQP